jgi:cytochrome c-type biogenesis protein CcmH/NrfG
MQELLTALEEALQNKETATLEDLARQSIVEKPDQAEGYYFLAEASFINGQLRNAEICLGKAIELDGENLQYLLRLAVLKEEQGMSEDARLLYGKAFELEPENVKIAIGLARYAIEEAQDYEEAKEILDKAIEANADVAELYRLRAHAQILDEDADDALEDIERSLELEEHEEAYVLKVNALIELEDREALTEAYEQLIDFMGENSLEYRVHYANFLLGEEIYDKAETQLNAALKLSQQAFDLPLQGLLGLAVAGQGRHQEAIAIFDKMAEHDPKDEEIYIQRAEAKLALGDTKAALADLEQAESLLSGDNQLPIKERRAEILLENEQFEAAKALYEELSKSDFMAREGYFGLGLTAHKTGDLKTAYKALREAQKLKHPKAKTYLYEHFAKQLGQIESQLMDKYATDLAKNANSPLLQKYFGAFAKFDPYKNKLSSDLPKEVAKALLAEIEDTAFMMTDKGLLLLNPIEKRALRAIYRIEEEDEEEAVIEVIPLDGSERFSAIIGIEGKHLFFEAQLKKARNVGFKLIPAEKMGNKDKANLKKYVSAEELNYLGDKAAKIVASLA